MIALALMLSCSNAPTTPAVVDEPLVYAPPQPRLHRLTQNQLRNSLEAATGLTVTADLPGDTKLYGYTVVGGSELTWSPSEVEEVEAVVWDLARELAPDVATIEAGLGCDLGADIAEDETGEDCIRGMVVERGLSTWRRPLSGAEVDGLVDLYLAVRAELDDPTLGVQAVWASLLLAPQFLYRVEQGEADPDWPGDRRLTDWELASRLSFFLVDGPPDEALLLAAERGDLAGRETFDSQVRRLLRSDAGQQALFTFFEQTLDVDQLDLVSKNPDEYPEWTDELRDSLRTEVQALVTRVLIEEGQPLDALFTTDLAWVDSHTAAIYGFQEGTAGLVSIPGGTERGGVLGRGAWLAVHAGNTLTSPTKRGKFVRTRLLCQDIPAPPPDIPTIDQVDPDLPLRDRLEQHMSDPACSGCHELMDPIGFGFEYFDAVGAWRARDMGVPIDATGDLDGVAFDGAEELSWALADHPRLSTCMTRQLFRYAKGEHEADGEEAAIVQLAQVMSAGSSLEEVVVALVGSDAFRRLEPPASGDCEPSEEGRSRACDTACGEGVETCTDGQWSGCTAPPVQDEICDGLDQDCDGDIDEQVTRPCDADWGPGTQTCDDGAWLACTGPSAPPESCNGVDDDGDGLVDEDLDVFFDAVTTDDLRDVHSGCIPSNSSDTDTCHSAVHRICATSGCAVSGLGLVQSEGDDHALVCIDDTQGVVHAGSYLALAEHHSGCTEADPIGPDCNAAINRWCASIGQVTGYGPVEHAGDLAYLVCTPQAVVYDTTYTVLSAYHPNCDGSSERKGAACNEAMHAFCRDEGFATGHGPLENSGDVAHVACLGEG